MGDGGLGGLVQLGWHNPREGWDTKELNRGAGGLAAVTAFSSEIVVVFFRLVFKEEREYRRQACVGHARHDHLLLASCLEARSLLVSVSHTVLPSV